nr:glutamate receptor 3.7 [Ipomoea batatas]
MRRQLGMFFFSVSLLREYGMHMVGGGMHIWLETENWVECERPAVVNVGAAFTFNSVTGRAAKTAMEIAVSDVNGDPTILNGTKLNLIKVDANSSAFMGSIGVATVAAAHPITPSPAHSSSPHCHLPHSRQISIDVTVFERLTLEEEAEGGVGNATAAAAGQVQSSTVASQTSGVTGGGKGGGGTSR